MLLTTCPNCSAQFKVQPEQLNVRQGRVMCGRCRGVFNAFQSLMRVADDELAGEVVEAPTPTPPPTPPLSSEPLPDLTDALFLREEPLPLSQDFTQTDFASDVRLAAELTQPTPPFSPPLSSRNVGFDDSKPLEDLSDSVPPSVSLLPAAHEESTAATTGDNPLLAPVMGYRQSVKPTRARLWTVGAVLLMCGLTAQFAYAFRSTIIQSFPQTRPAYMTACEWAGCNLTWGRDDGAIRIEASDLIELPGKTGRILLTATLVNRGTARHDLPSLELKLTDNANQVILSRVLLPGEYLGRAPTKDESLAPNVEIYVNLSFELTPRAQASGYGVRAFYN